MSGTLYQDAIMTLAKDTSASGRLDYPDASATVDNPLCGDRVTVDINLTEGRIDALGHHVRGCALCKASAALLAQESKGLTADQLAAAMENLQLFLKDQSNLNGTLPSLSVFEPVKVHKSRHDCVLLPFHAALEAVKNISQTH